MRANRRRDRYAAFLDSADQIDCPHRTDRANVQASACRFSNPHVASDGKILGFGWQTFQAQHQRDLTIVHHAAFGKGHHVGTIDDRQIKHSSVLERSF